MDPRLIGLAQEYAGRRDASNPSADALRSLYYRYKAVSSKDGPAQPGMGAARLGQAADLVGALPLRPLFTFPANVLSQSLERYDSERRALERLRADIARIRAVVRG